MVKNAGIVNKPLKWDPMLAMFKNNAKENSPGNANGVIAPILQLFQDPILRFPSILMCPRIWLSMCLKMTTDPSFSLYRTSISSTVQLLSHGQMMCVKGIAFGNVALDPIGCKLVFPWIDLKIQF